MLLTDFGLQVHFVLGVYVLQLLLLLVVNNPELAQFHLCQSNILRESIDNGYVVTESVIYDLSGIDCDSVCYVYYVTNNRPQYSQQVHSSQGHACDIDASERLLEVNESQHFCYNTGDDDHE